MVNRKLECFSVFFLNSDDMFNLFRKNLQFTIKRASTDVFPPVLKTGALILIRRQSQFDNRFRMLRHFTQNCKIGRCFISENIPGQFPTITTILAGALPDIIKYQDLLAKATYYHFYWERRFCSETLGPLCWLSVRYMERTTLCQTTQWCPRICWW